MENFDYAIVEEAAKQLYIKALCDLPPDVREALKKAYARETQPAARSIFEAMFKAIEIADTKKTLLCQDTGLPIYKVKIGSGYTWNGAKIKAALYEGAKRATVEFPFRSSATHDLTRVNPQTSVGPGLPVTYFDFDGERSDLDILMMPKGSGSENMSKMHMFYPQPVSYTHLDVYKRQVFLWIPWRAFHRTGTCRRSGLVVVPPYSRA